MNTYGVEVLNQCLALHPKSNHHLRIKSACSRVQHQQPKLGMIIMCHSILDTCSSVGSNPMQHNVAFGHLARMAGHPLAAMALDLARVSRGLSAPELDTCMKFCEVVKAHQQHSVAKLITHAHGHPLLCSYTSDATPLRTRVRFMNPGGKTATLPLVREGKALHEYLLERSFFKKLDKDGVAVPQVIITEPRVLSEGKTSWNLYTAAELSSPHLKSRGHTGISISHYCFDRLAYSALSRKLLQRHALFHHIQKSMSNDHTILDELTDLVISTPCANHDAQNAFKWALSVHLAPADAVNDLHICIEALRNSYDLIHSHLHTFLEHKVSFTDADYDEADVASFWTAFGAEGQWLDQLVELNPWWADGRLWISSKCKDWHDIDMKLSKTLLYIFKFRMFTESRWCTAGPACRALVASLAVGLGGLVDLIRKNPKASDFFLHGFGKLSAGARKYSAIAGLSAYVPDSFLVELLADDRVARRIGDLESVMSEELQWLDSLPALTWDRLANIADCGWGPSQFRTAIIHSGIVACGFLNRRVLSAARGLPWSLAKGNIDENIIALGAQATAPDEPCAAKIYRLFHLGAR